MTAFSARIALVGDRSPHVRSHARVPLLLDALRRRDLIDLDAYWVPTTDAADDLDGFDGIWLLPGSPYRSEAGALAASRTAREQAIPFLSTCAGFQHTLLEYARNVCDLRVQHAENDPEADDPLIVPLACSLAGHQGPVQITPGSLAERILGGSRTVERYHCSYGLAPGRLDVLAEHGLRFTGFDDEGDARIVELPDHPFYLATLFQPELAGDGTRPHPIIRTFATAAVGRTNPAP